MLFKQLFIFLLFNLAASNMAIASISAETTTETNAIKKPITKPPSPPPKIPPNKIKPGGGLELFTQSCTDNTQSLTALVPVENPVLAASEHPTLLFYIPDRPAQIHHGEFTIVTADEKSTIYTNQITIDSSPGIMSLQTPQIPQYALKDGNIYHWYFKLYCQQDPSFKSYVDVHGWIKKVASTPETAQQIETASPQLWYDSLAKTAANLAIAPENQTFQQQWLKLLQEIDLENLAQTPIQTLELE